MKTVGHTSEFLLGIYWWTLKNPENQKNIAGDIIILHICTKNQNHMSYSSWYTEWDIFFCNRKATGIVILGHFLLFYPTIEPEN